MSEVSAEDVQEYMRCLLGRRPFIKTYPICGKELCSLQTMTTKSRMRLNKFMAWCETQKDIAADTSDRANLVFRTDRACELEKLSDEDILKALHTTYDDWVYESYVAHIRCLQEFIQLIETLREKVLEVDFWKGAGQG